MQVTVRLFGALREHAATAGWARGLPDGATVAALVEELRGERLLPEALLASCAFAVNQEYVQPSRVLADGDEVAILPPVSGGTESLEAARRGPELRVALVRDPIDSAVLQAEIKRSSDGAVCVFDGIVRDNTRGRGTLHLDYEAYEEMALKQMGALAEEAVTRWKVRDVTIVHRLGRLFVGETSVLILVASAHRGAAFDACRWLIDTLKKQVPIWKREQFIDGAVWTDGEPFPEHIVGAGR